MPNVFLSQGNGWGNRTEFNLGQRNYNYENGKWFKRGLRETKEKIYPKRLIVKKKKGEDLYEVDFKKLGIVEVVKISKKLLGGYYIVSIKDTGDPFSIAEKLFKESSFEYVEFDAFITLSSTPNDTYWNHTWNNGQWNLKSDKLNMPWAWDITTGNSSTILAIIDYGIDIEHDDLKDNLWNNPGEVSNGIDDDGNGLVDDLHGWNFGNNSNYLGTDFHGTGTAGIAVARSNNGEYIAGIAGGWGNTQGVSLMGLVYTDEDAGNEGDELYISTVMNSIDYASDKGADVVSMSFGSNFDHPEIKDAITIAISSNNCIFIAASGNNSYELAYPAEYSNVISVGSSDENDYVVSYNSQTAIDYYAPENVISLADNNSTRIFTNTSAATPHVSGVVSLLRSINSNLTLMEVRNILDNSCDIIGSIYKRIDARSS